MAKERCSLHKGKGKGSAKHNQHLHMDKDIRDIKIFKCQHGKFFEFGEDLMKDDIDYLTEHELAFYEDNYSIALTQQNIKHIKEGHHDRTKTMKEFYKCKRYAPVEEILQWGNIKTANDELPSREIFDAIICTYALWLQEWSKAHGNHLHILDFSNHYDEATPHSQLRYIWDYVDENGVTQCAQEKAMESAGIPLPEPDKENSRKNNRNVTFTAMCREMFQDIVESYGFEVERETLPKRPHVSTYAYIQRQIQQQKLREEQLDEREGSIEFREMEVETAETTLDERETEITNREVDLNHRMQTFNAYRSNELKRIKELENEAIKKKGQRVVRNVSEKGSAIQERGQGRGTSRKGILDGVE